MRAKEIKYQVVKRLQELAEAIDDKKYEHDLDYLRYNLRKIEIMYEDYLGMKSNREYKIKTEFNKSYK
tara:strand:+ start:1027 stop:1230 length:204 start_codon:yes stop_codon:yes gene_type:complete